MSNNKIFLFILALALLIIFIIVAISFENKKFNLVNGVSMSPTFSECALLISDSNVNPFDVEVGDIVIIDISEQNAEFNKIAHRVVENNLINETIATRGDNDDFYDYPNSIDGFFGYDKFVGLVENHYDLPKVICNA